MSETKADLEAKVADLEAENAQLRGQLATAARVAQAAPRRPHLSEGERQELAMYGVTTSPFTGARLTADQVRAELADDDRHARVEIPDASPELARTVPQPRPERTPVEGVDFVYPSIAPGQLAADARR